MAKATVAEPGLDRDLLEELRTSEARFRAICETAPLGIYVSEVPRGVVYVNPAMQQILGRSQAELLGERWKTFLHPDDARQALAERAGHYERSAPMRINARYVRSDGRVIWTHLRAAPIIEDGELRGYVGVMEDMTEQRALQAQLATAGRLASVGTLAASVAHEVNTPLAVTLSNVEWAQRRLNALIEQLEQAPSTAAPSMAELRSSLGALITPLDHAHDAARRVSLIMKDLSVFSRPEANDEGAASLDRVLGSATRMASHELKHRARLVLDYGELPRVIGSEARLGQVFLNLLINAAHAIPEGRIDDHEVRVHARTLDSETVMVEVRDTGTGIAPNVIENIFDPFFTTKERALGTGLGLAICHRIVSAVGGRFEVESELGRGSIFRVLLRTAAEGSLPMPAPTPAPRPPARRARVLVIDDDPMILDTIELVLGEHNDVVTTTSAREALRRFETGERFDAVFCDLMMPDMNGMELHSELSKRLPGVADGLTFLTGGAVTASAREFLERVPNRCVTKPFALAELEQVIAEHADE